MSFVQSSLSSEQAKLDQGERDKGHRMSLRGTCLQRSGGGLPLISPFSLRLPLPPAPPFPISPRYMDTVDDEQLQLGMALSASLHPDPSPPDPFPPGKRGRRGKGKNNEGAPHPTRVITTSSTESQKILAQRANAIIQEVHVHVHVHVEYMYVLHNIWMYDGCNEPMVCQASCACSLLMRATCTSSKCFFTELPDIILSQF